ncbi:hypothetical protein FHW58_002851 [Duganella sp. 1224]|uniref:hypothetical protein n=1 Tax=Duganella sp. 1224 TaxID=2587052 RepID=UPI0015C71C8B|nr:hypothetical protein [Duganella sp. 1224]NYE61644.1 hypothetical protein [Duganella sp. 1224]
MRSETSLVDRLYQFTFLTFRDTLGGKPGYTPQPPLPPLPAAAPRLSGVPDYEHEAMHYGHRYRGAFILNFSLGFVAVLLALIPLTGLLSEHTLHRAAPWLTVAELATIVSILLIHLYGRDPVTYDSKSGWLRAIGLRRINQGWRQRWARARLAHEHVRHASLMLGFPGAPLQAGGMLKDRYADIAATLQQAAARCAPAPADAGYRTAYRDYFLGQIRDQARYHRINMHRCHHIHHRLHHTASVCFYLTLGVCLAHFWLHHPLLSVLAALLPALAATCHGLLATGEFQKLAQQSHDMQAELAQLEQEVKTDQGATLTTLHEQVGKFFSLMVEDALGWHVTLSDKDLATA